MQRQVWRKLYLPGKMNHVYAQAHRQWDSGSLGPHQQNPNDEPHAPRKTILSSPASLSIKANPNRPLSELLLETHDFFAFFRKIPSAMLRLIRKSRSARELFIARYNFSCQGSG